MIEYTTDLSAVNEHMLHGFFAGWPNPPSTSSHMRILKGSYLVWLAIDTSANRVVGFINAISDGVLCAYIPLLEVLPAYQNTGIGKELVARMLDSFKNMYMIDLLCDKKLQSYYAKFGMISATGAFVRNYDRQNCE
ncbi:MAG: GNAT family N-acetyltransferase [Clostridia bacterium]|nr:GNAT family N-acetyltransferase [Clostridia bacterium]